MMKTLMTAASIMRATDSKSPSDVCVAERRSAPVNLRSGDAADLAILELASKGMK